jgi:hypothetical protein
MTTLVTARMGAMSNGTRRVMVSIDEMVWSMAVISWVSGRSWSEVSEAGYPMNGLWRVRPGTELNRNYSQ